jgi:hypothetical protein
MPLSRFSARLLPLALTAATLAAACSSGGTAPQPTPTASVSSPGPSQPGVSSPSSPTPAGGGPATGPGAGAGTAWGHGPGCPAGGPAVPARAITRPVGDVDGDGRADTGWIAAAAGSTRFGVRTATGARLSAAFALPGGAAARSVLIADVDGAGTVVALATDGRTVLLFRVLGCAIGPVSNAEGDQYAFDLGFRGTGTGVGCLGVGGGPVGLVGLNATPGDGQTTVRRTRIDLTGLQARNGRSDEVRVPRGGPADESAHQVTCGRLTMARDGLTVVS